MCSEPAAALPFTKKNHFARSPIPGLTLFLSTGSTLLVSAKFVHTDRRFYADPEIFDPDNFLPEACHNRHPYAFIPFSAGYRNCIGIKYAMLQIKITVSTLVRHNLMLPSDKCPTPEHLRLMFLSTLKLVDGCYVKIIPRTRQNDE